jgi:hypothetical protein
VIGLRLIRLLLADGHTVAAQAATGVFERTVLRDGAPPGLTLVADDRAS